MIKFIKNLFSKKAESPRRVTRIYLREPEDIEAEYSKEAKITDISIVLESRWGVSFDTASVYMIEGVVTTQIECGVNPELMAEIDAKMRALGFPHLIEMIDTLKTLNVARRVVCEALFKHNIRNQHKPNEITEALIKQRNNYSEAIERLVEQIREKIKEINGA